METCSGRVKRERKVATSQSSRGKTGGLRYFTSRPLLRRADISFCTWRRVKSGHETDGSPACEKHVEIADKALRTEGVVSSYSVAAAWPLRRDNR